MPNPPDVSKGYTLLELMVTVTIVGILMGVAVPSFTSVIDSNRLTTYANDLVTALNFARSEAIKRGQQVTVRRKGVTSAQWELGWDVFVDRDKSNAFNDDGDAALCEVDEDCLLRTYDKFSGGYTLRTSLNTDYKDYAAFLPSGFSKIISGDLYALCNGTDFTQSRSIAVISTGRVSVSSATSSCQ
jgi:type IV fimbrial biogenesis protein FimT